MSALTLTYIKIPTAESTSITAPITLPDTPTNFAVTTISSSTLQLDWDPQAGVTFSIWRDAILIAEGVDDVTYSDGGLVDGQLYVYSLRAKDDVTGNLSLPSSANGTPSDE